MGSQSIRFRIALWTGLCLLITSGVNLTASVISARKEAMVDARQMVTASAVENMLTIRTELEKAMFTARGFAQSAAAAKDQQHVTPFNRQQLSSMLRRVILENPDFVGGSTCWEPNAFDGRDAEFANTPGHDETGRIGYYWYQDGPNQVSMDYISAMDNEIWYKYPLKKKHETLCEPYWFPIQDQQVLMTTVTVPIMDQGQVFGVATIDLTLGFLQQLVDSANVFDSAGSTMAIISNDGVQVAASGAGAFAGRSLAGVEGYSAALLESITRGESYYDWNDKGMEICVPLIVGENDEPWGIFIQVPAKQVMASVNAFMWHELGSGVISIAIALMLLWVIATKISQPIRMGTEMAESIGRGDLSPRLHLDRRDEVGKLADAMNRMAESLADKAHLAENIAADERKQRLDLASELDALGMSLQNMTRNLNSVLGEVNSGSEQLIQGSSQLTERCRLVGMGLTQQESLLDQLTRTVGIVTHHAQNSSQHAQEAIELASQIKRDVVRCQEAMQQVLDDSQNQPTEEVLHQLGERLASCSMTILDGVNGLVELVQEGITVNEEQDQSVEQLCEELDQVRRVTRHNASQVKEGGAVVEVLADNALALSHELQRFKFLEQLGHGEEGESS